MSAQVIDQTPNENIRPKSPPLHWRGDWTFTFEFDCNKPMSRDEYLELLKLASEGVAKAFKDNYPKYLFDELKNVHCLDLMSFAQNDARSVKSNGNIQND